MTLLNDQKPFGRQSQNGAVLVISLIILLVLTVMVMSGNRTVIMQEKMTAAVRDANMSLQDAEIGLRAAAVEIEKLTGTTGFSDTGAGGFYSKDNGPINVFDSANWVDSKTMAASSDAGSDNVARFYIEDVDVIVSEDETLTGINMMGYGQTAGGGDVNAFKIVSRATGTSGTAERIVVGYYGKRL